jgi:hypothetical protein
MLSHQEYAKTNNSKTISYLREQIAKLELAGTISYDLCFSLETHEQSNKIGLVKEISTRGDGTSLIVFNYLTNEQDDIVRELLNNNWMKQSDNLKEKLSIYFSEIDGKISTVSTFWRDKLDVPEERDVAAICRTIYE